MNLDLVIQWVVSQSILIAAVFLVVLIATWTLRNASAHWRYLLWLVVLAKCFMPPVVDVPLPISLQMAENNPAASTRWHSDSVSVGERGSLEFAAPAARPTGAAGAEADRKV